jgi:hypothetical protein
MYAEPLAVCLCCTERLTPVLRRFCCFIASLNTPLVLPLASLFGASSGGKT